jgi:hypothetical protein
LKSNVLVIASGRQQRLNFKRFKADFIPNQFKQENVSNEHVGGGARFGEKVICVSVPKSLVIEDGNNHVTMV